MLNNVFTSKSWSKSYGHRGVRSYIEVSQKKKKRSRISNHRGNGTPITPIPSYIYIPSLVYCDGSGSSKQNDPFKPHLPPQHPSCSHLWGRVLNLSRRQGLYPICIQGQWSSQLQATCQRGTVRLSKLSLTTFIEIFCLNWIIIWIVNGGSYSSSNIVVGSILLRVNVFGDPLLPNSNLQPVDNEENIGLQSQITQICFFIWKYVPLTWHNILKIQSLNLLTLTDSCMHDQFKVKWTFYKNTIQYTT